MTIRMSLFFAVIAVVVMRHRRGGWSRENLRTDAMAVAVMTAVIAAATKVIGL